MIPNLLENISKYIQDAARLRLRLDRLHKDRDDIDNGHKLYYAVDTNIVLMFSQPEKMVRHGKIFHDSSEDKAEMVVRGLANHIFFELRAAGQKLILMPPHQRELRNISAKIIAKGLKEATPTTLGHKYRALQTHYDEFEDTKNVSKFASFIKEKALDIAHLIYGDSHSALVAAQNLAHLFTRGRLLFLDAVLSKVTTLGPDCQDLQKACDNFDEIKYNSIYGDWLSQFHKSYKGDLGRAEFGIDNDAATLAMMDYLNSLLAASRSKIILITTDTWAYNIAMQHKVDYLGDAPFAKCFIRHPMAFLEQVIEYRDNSCAVGVSGNGHYHYGLRNWLDTYLVGLDFTEWPDEAEFHEYLATADASTIAASLRPKYEIRENALEKYSIDRQDYEAAISVKNIVVQRPRTDAELVDKMIEFLDSNNFREFVSQTISGAQNHFNKIAVEGGLHFLYSPRDISGLPPRGVPPLRFFEHVKAREHVNRIMYGQRKDIIEHLGMLQELWREDESGYMYYLASGILFAAIGLWGVTTSLARHSLDIANGVYGPVKDKSITGHEAAYLAAVAARHDSTTVRDLNTAQRLLDDAYGRYRKYKEDDSVIDVRFEAEQLALYLTRHLFFKSFTTKPQLWIRLAILPPDNARKVKGEALPSIPEIQHQLYDLCKKIVKEEDDVIKLKVERHVLTNIVSTIHLNYMVNTINASSS